MGKIKLQGLEIYGNHGYYKDEKQLTQKFQVNISFELNIEKAAAGDDLEETVNYEEVVNLCQKVMDEPTNLIETLAVNTAKAIKSSFPFLRNIHIELAKPEAQLGARIENVVVEYILA